MKTRTREKALEAYMFINNEITEIESLLQIVKDDFIWSIIDILVERKSKKIYDYLLFKYNETNDKDEKGDERYSNKDKYRISDL